MEFLIWYLVVAAIGIGFMPLTRRLFYKFQDGGWIFAKSIGIFVSGYLMWVLSGFRLMKFTGMNCLLVLLICIGANVLVSFFDGRKKIMSLPAINWRLVLLEELLFLAIFAAWTYVVCYNPAAYGTEKFMDYGFMTSMMRAEYMPPADPWYSGETINYYYGGQYLATWLTKVSGVSVGSAYNLMRTMIGAFAFAMPFSLVYTLLQKVQQCARDKVCSWQSALGGILAGLAVSVCGNVHYLIYGVIFPLLGKRVGTEDAYYYPDSTRYIGHDPLVDTDKTIHEFPSYSQVVGDLHAHMANIMFVLVVVGLALAWALRQKDEERKPGFKIKSLLQPEILAIGFFTGMFRWTNFWDFPIYFVVGGSVVFFVNLSLYRKSLKTFVLTTAAQAAVVLLVGYVASLPFTLTFDKIASRIQITHSHSAFYQLLILWGLPVVIVLAFVVFCIRSYRKNLKNKKEAGQEIKGGIVSFFCHLNTADLVVLLMGLCAMGLILMPEIIYMEDIYTNSYRANTMFKLTYQGYILFGLCMGYILIRGLMFGKKAVKTVAWAGIVIVLLTAAYSGNAVRSKFGNIFDTSRFKGIDASIYVSESFESDYEAVNWLNENVEGQPVVLEAHGDSYTGYERVSVATGLPTVLGWYVHEWLWRGDTEAENVRKEEIEQIYTSADREAVESLIEKYNISYIYIGALEREQYPSLNDKLLQEIGTVAYSNGVDTYIMKVGGGN